MTLAAFLGELMAGRDDRPVGAVVTAGEHRFKKLPYGWVAIY